MLTADGEVASRHYITVPRHLGAEEIVVLAREIAEAASIQTVPMVEEKTIGMSVPICRVQQVRKQVTGVGKKNGMVLTF